MQESLSSRLEIKRRSFIRKGVTYAVASGICYGLYTTFLTLAQSKGVWSVWIDGDSWDGHSALSTFTIIFGIAALAAGINDLFSGLWSMIVCFKKGLLSDLIKTITTKPGWTMMLCAAIGGPFATIAYVIALNSAMAAGNPGIIVPIAALNCAVGAILGRILFKQNLALHTIMGILICLAAATIIGGTTLVSFNKGVGFACLFALMAAIGWGFEGCVAGFGTALIDYRIGITIRQVTAGLLETLIAFPTIATIGGNGSDIGPMFWNALTDHYLFVFAIAGLFAMPAYSLWYKGNSMCGTALGMACNGMYAFWAPFFIWVILGLFQLGGTPDQFPPLSWLQWFGAIIMVFGIFCVALNPLSFSVRSSAYTTRNPLPLNYAILLHFLTTEKDDATGVYAALEPEYLHHQLFSISAIADTLAVAKENELLTECDNRLSHNGDIITTFSLSPTGRSIVEKYLV